MVDMQTNIAYLAALSLASERLVEMVRGFSWTAFPREVVSPAASPAPADRTRENLRSAKINLVALAAGIFTAFAAYFLGVLPVATDVSEVLVFGVLASAGSSTWNAVLSYLLKLKESLPPAPPQSPAGVTPGR